jgi:hypothetical protein
MICSEPMGVWWGVTVWGGRRGGVIYGQEVQKLNSSAFPVNRSRTSPVRRMPGGLKRVGFYAK